MCSPPSCHAPCGCGGKMHSFFLGGKGLNLQIIHQKLGSRWLGRTHLEQVIFLSQQNWAVWENSVPPPYQTGWPPQRQHLGGESQAQPGTLPAQASSFVSTVQTSLCGLCLSLGKIKIITLLSFDSLKIQLYNPSQHGHLLCLLQPKQQLLHLYNYVPYKTSLWSDSFTPRLWVLCRSISNSQPRHLPATKSLDIFIKRHRAIHI